MKNVQASILAPVVNNLAANKVLARHGWHGDDENRRVEFCVRSAVADIIGVDATNLSLAIDDLMAAEVNGDEFAENAARAAFIIDRLAHWETV